ncbi:hypothetical protein HPP92_020026 [Vanilla planifolia]|uniref:Uncharacterized protein n=1 Tax=Vanilla planifolia TaxID=51239 RepID=A0A835ULB9_VANPL|nr:hypothetical protein HPP92_020026 [Vanilla planifolia]
MVSSASSSNSVLDGRSNSMKRPENLFVWREFVWGALAGAFGEGMMHPVDTVKTRIQSQAIITGTKSQKNIFQMVQTIWASDGVKGFYRGIAPGVTGSLATGATYFGVIESTKHWIEAVNPSLGGHWAHFIAGAIGDTLGSFVYVPCEVIKQRMQVQGTRSSWTSTMMKQNVSQKSAAQMYHYYTGMLHAGHTIWKEHGVRWHHCLLSCGVFFTSNCHSCYLFLQQLLCLAQILLQQLHCLPVDILLCSEHNFGCSLNNVLLCLHGERPFCPPNTFSQKNRHQT